MRLIYNNDNSNKEEIIKQLQRDLPDEIRKEDQKKLIKELEREVKEYVANASDYGYKFKNKISNKFAKIYFL